MKKLHLIKYASSAFTLIEFLIYISLFTVIFVLFLGFLTQEWIAMLRVVQRQNNELSLALACDVLRRDLLGIGSDLNDCNESDFIIRKVFLNSFNLIESEWVHWYVNKNNLMRAAGQYDSVKGFWTKKSVCLVCTDIERITLLLDKNMKSKSISGAYVTLARRRNGNLLEHKIHVGLKNRII